MDLHALAQEELGAEKPAPENDDRPAGLPVRAGPIEAMEGDYDGMVELVERQLMVFLMITTDDQAVLLEDDPTEVYQDDDKLLYFTQTSLLNSFNGRAERMASYGYELEPGDIGLVLGVRMSRQILFQLGLAEHVLKVGGKATRVWKTTRDSWKHPAGNPHLKKVEAHPLAAYPDWVCLSEKYDAWKNLRTGFLHIGYWFADNRQPKEIRWDNMVKEALLLPKDQYAAWLARHGAGAPLEELEGMAKGFEALPPPDTDS